MSSMFVGFMMVLASLSTLSFMIMAFSSLIEAVTNKNHLDMITLDRDRWNEMMQSDEILEEITEDIEAVTKRQSSLEDELAEITSKVTALETQTTNDGM